MELRVLRYFLTVAREENITRAARQLHLSQPTLSRQLMQLEDEFGVRLFHRGGHSISLTQEGLLLKRRAQELLALSEKTVRELSHRENTLAGEIYIGCGETKNMATLAKHMAEFRRENPLVQFSIYSANADDIKERMESGSLDMGLLMEPVDISKYEFIHMPWKERWGALLPADSIQAQKGELRREDMQQLPLLLPRRETVKDQLAGWFGDGFSQLPVAGEYNLILNAAAMVREGMGAALCFDLGNVYEQLRFVPLVPAVETGAVLAWKKGQTLPRAASLFIQELRNALQA